MSLAAEEALHAARVGQNCMSHYPGIAYKCGPYALNSLLSVKAGKPIHSPLMSKVQSSDKGTNLAQLKDWADQLGLSNYQLAKRAKGAPIVVPSVMHWKLDHFAAIVKKDGERFRTKDPTFGTGGNITLSLAALEAETDGYFLIPGGALPKGWQAVGKTEAQTIWGKGYANGRDPKGPCQPKQPMSPGSDGCCKGLATASAWKMHADLNIQDVPLSYTCPVGPKMDFLANYNSKESFASANPPFTRLAQIWWSFNWLSYLYLDPSSNATVITRGGGAEYYAYPYQPNLYSQAKLVNVSSGVYQRQLPDGSIEVFNQPDGSGRIFMTEVIDSQGNSATIQFDTNFRITTITDAIGQQSTLTYGSNTLGNAGFYVVTQITDPFSRSCTFTHDSSYTALLAITDAVGMTSQFHCIESSAAVDALTTPYGTTSFYAYTRTGILSLFDTLQFLFPDGTTSVVINQIGFTTKTFFWDREATKLYSSEFFEDLSGVISGPHATTTRWCFSVWAPVAWETAVPYFVVPPLENQITYTYPGGFPEPGYPGYYIAGTMNLPDSITRTVSGSTTQTWQYSYNTLGHVTQEIDPVGRKFDYTYASNGIDLLEKDQTLSTTTDINGIWSSYSQHLPGAYKDGSGRVTSYTYNSFGELATLTDPDGKVWTYSYNSDGYLTQIDGPLSGSSDVTTISYDGYGRRYQVTDSEGYTLTYSYDALDRVTQISHPDGTSEKTTYDKLDAVLLTDRLGRCTLRSYDSMDQIAYEIDPLGRKTQYKWCACGSLMALSDPNGNKTSWQHDLEGRVIKKVCADQTACAYSYDNVGRKSSRTDAIGQTTNYSYNLDNTLYQVSYSNAVNPTSTVTYSYDPHYLRLSSVANGWGTVSYSYNPYITSSSSTTTGAGKVSTVTNSVISNSDISYSYDVVGRVTNRSINGSSNSTTWAYDAMSRITSEGNPLGTFNYAYVDNASGSSKGTTRLSSITYPNSQVTHFNWFGNLGDQRLQGILNLKSDGTCISQFNYGYNSAGEITRWQQQQGPLNNNLYGLKYDLAGQLVSANSAFFSFLAAPYANSYYYSYDSASNRIGAQQHTVASGSIGGSVTPGDILTITVYDAGLSGGQESVSYTVQSGDDLAAVNNGLMSAFLGNTNLQAIGVYSGWGGTVFNLGSNSSNVTTYSASTSSGATETITLGVPSNNCLANATVVGTPTAGDVLTITVHDPALSGGQESVSYTVQSGDTLGNIAIALGAAINSNTNLQAINVNTWYLQNTAQISSFSANVTTYTQSASTGATEGIVFSLNQNENIYGSLGGSVSTGDVMTVTVHDSGLPGGSQAASYTVQSGDSLNDVATGLANALSANSDLYAILYAYTDGGSNLILYSISTNPTTYRATTSSGSTETIVLGTSVNQTGASFGSAQYQYNNVNELVSIGSSGMTRFEGTTNKPVKSGSVVTNAMSIQQTPANPTTYGVPEYTSATETVTFDSLLNGNVNATVGGTVTTGDVISVIIYDDSLSGGQEQVFYTAQSGDTLSDIATGIANAVNADTNITALGMSATSSSTTFSIAQPTTTYSSTNSSGATEYISLGNNNNGNLIAEIGGTPTAGDTVTLTVNNPILSGGTDSVTYTVQSGDTNISIAAGVAALVNANTNLTGIGIKAVTDGTATLSWSEAFTAHQSAPGWNDTKMSATDAGNNTAVAPYSIYTLAPNAANPNFDLNGNMTSDGTNAYLWDAENRLVQIDYPGSGNNSQFSYDGLGRCVQIVENSGGSPTSTIQLVWYESHLAETRDSSGGVIAQFFKRGQTVASNSYFYDSDHLGSVREVTDGSGNLQTTYGYDSFGRESKAGNVDSDLQYANYYRHARGDLYLTLNRFYNARLGRFINPDPLEDNLETNPYTYAFNDPIAFSDPFGLVPNQFIYPNVKEAVKAGFGEYRQLLELTRVHKTEMYFWVYRPQGGSECRWAYTEPLESQGPEVTPAEVQNSKPRPAEIGAFAHSHPEKRPPWSSARGYENFSTRDIKTLKGEIFPGYLYNAYDELKIYMPGLDPKGVIVH